MKILIIISVCASMTLIACNNKERNPVVKQSIDTGLITTENNNTVLQDSSKVSHLKIFSKHILQLIKDNDYLSIVKYIDDKDGLRFSPYGYIDTTIGIVFSKAAFSDQLSRASQKKYLWGKEDGSGEEIRLTIDEYMKRFVYDVDFLNAEVFQVNQFIAKGNSFNNLLSVFPGADFTESHFSGFNKKYEGMDWKSLRLVFKKRNTQYYLVGVVHDQWTI